MSSLQDIYAARAYPFLTFNSLTYIHSNNKSGVFIWLTCFLLQIFDFMNVNSIHNATFAKLLPAGYLEQARALANFHEYGIFSSPQIDGIGNSMLLFIT